MNDKTFEALGECCVKYFSFMCGKLLKLGAINCPLCQLYEHCRCIPCPVNEKVRQMYCYGTPYKELADIVEKEYVMFDITRGKAFANTVELFEATTKEFFFLLHIFIEELIKRSI